MFLGFQNLDAGFAVCLVYKQMFDVVKYILRGGAKKENRQEELSWRVFCVLIFRYK